ncbi:MAG TPA: DNA polymerase Y family protein [Puia sp.]|nr:DNA polymerase Y family protein [Puia sp.]
MQAQRESVKPAQRREVWPGPHGRKKHGEKQAEMGKRFLSLWFRHLTTDYMSIRRPPLREIPFVMAAPDHGRKIITAVNEAARIQGIDTGMVVADARVLYPTLEVIDEQPGLTGRLLRALAVWGLRFTPVTAIDGSDGLMFETTGCDHLWGGEEPYLSAITSRLAAKGYAIRAGMADTIGAAWAVARYGRGPGVLSWGAATIENGYAIIVPPGHQTTALLDLPPAALRLAPETLARLHKLGLVQIGPVASFPRRALRRRLGGELLLRIDQAFGVEEEGLQPVQPVEPYQERLPCLEPIGTAAGIGIALERLLERLCGRLQQDGKGLREAVFKAFRVDGRIMEARIGTNRGSNHAPHLFRLFEEKIRDFEPDLGIELFSIDAPKTDDVSPLQKTLWTGACGPDDPRLAELADRISNKLGPGLIHRYLPAEHYWPERSFVPARSFDDKQAGSWPTDRPRPVHLLPVPERIEVTAPIPDYPPMLFRYRNKLHKIVHADGPERIGQEWWIEGALHRDYYIVEDETGGRYWLFRAGHYAGDQTNQWYLHGFFG